MPVVVTSSKRLVLEMLSQEHFDDLAALLANEKVHQYFPKTLSKEESQQFLKRIQHKQSTDGHSFWAVVRKEDDRFLGICGLLLQTIDGINELEVAYRINDEYWGNGYATEAAEACMKYAKEELRASRIISLILPINTSSIRVAEKNGLTLEKQAMFHGSQVNVYSKLL